MSKKIFSAQEWENVHSEALPSKLNDEEKQTSSIVYSDVEEDINRVVCEIHFFREIITTCDKFSYQK